MTTTESRPPVAPGEPAPDFGRARAHGAGQVTRQRIVAAGVDEEDIGPRLPLHHAMDQIEPYHFEFEG